MSRSPNSNARPTKEDAKLGGEIFKPRKHEARRERRIQVNESLEMDNRLADFFRHREPAQRWIDRPEVTTARTGWEIE